MNKKFFDDLLKANGLTRKDFADKTGVQYTTVGKWNDTDRPIPTWVESWIDNYKSKKKFEKIKELIKDEV